MTIRFGLNLFNGNQIVADPTLTPSDGTAAGSSELITGIGTDTDAVITIRNPNGVNVQMHWAPAVSLPNLHEWDTIGNVSTISEQTPVRLRKAFTYRIQADGPGVEAYIDGDPGSIEYDEDTYQGLKG